MYILGRRSRQELVGVHPDLVGVVYGAIKITEQDFTVVDGLRTLAEQKEYVRTGVSQTMKSRHLPQKDGFGHAVDLVPYINGKLRWELPACYKIMEAMLAASWALSVPLLWGGAWTVLYEEDPCPTPEALVKAYVERKRGAGKPAFIDAVHYGLIY